MTERITLESLITKPENCHSPKEVYKDSREALYEKELGNEDDDVEVTDRRIHDGKLFTFVWNRGKSNSNIDNTRDGKLGFSFYYARYVYRDEYLWEVPELTRDTRNTAFLGRIIEDPETNEEFDLPVMLVIQAKKESVISNKRIRIVSAYFYYNELYTRRYFGRMILRMNKQNKQPNQNSNSFESAYPNQSHREQIYDVLQRYKNK